MSKTKADDICQVRCFNTELVTQIRSTLPNEDTLAESKGDLKLLKYRNDGKLAYYSLKERRVTDILSYSLQEII